MIAYVMTAERRAVQRSAVQCSVNQATVRNKQ